MMDNPVSRVEVAALAERVTAEVPQLEQLAISAGLSGQVVVGMLRVRKADRGRGHASRALAMITAWADERGVVLTLTPDPAPLEGERPVSADRLTRWYARHGWRRNRGRYARHEYSEAMYRLPR